MRNSQGTMLKFARFPWSSQHGIHVRCQSGNPPHQGTPRIGLALLAGKDEALASKISKDGTFGNVGNVGNVMKKKRKVKIHQIFTRYSPVSRRNKASQENC